MATRATAYGWMPLAALAATVAVEAGERQSLAQAVDGLQDQFGVSDRAIGLLPAAMIIVGVVGSVPIGILADRVRRTSLLGVAMLLWTGGMVLSAIAPGYGALFAARLSVGAVEGNGPAAVSLIADYYPVKARARMFGLYQGGALLGTIVGLLAGGIAVSAGGWRWAFWIWVPTGVAVAMWIWVQREPDRGDQDADFSFDTTLALDVDGTDPTARLSLPPPARVGALDYAGASLREVTRELLRIPTMWLALAALTLSQLLLLGLQFWGVEFFKRAHGLSPTGAAVFTGLFGLGAAVGVLAGGYLSDHFLERGVINARILVVAAASIVAPLVLVPAFLIPHLALTVPLFVIGGLLLTLPLAPGEAIVSDVVVAPLRGRAGSVRSVVRSVAALSPVIIGALSDRVGLPTALASITPIYAIGGVLMLLATRTYGADLAFVAAETDRLRAGQ